MPMRTLRFACFFLLVSLHVQHILTKEESLFATPTNATQSVLIVDSSLPRTSTYTVDIPNKTKFVFRKCCGPGQVYHINTQIEGNNRCVNYTISIEHPSSTPIKISQQLFFYNETSLSQYANEDFEVDSGFPRNCDPDAMLEPDKLMADRFYPLPSGQLVVPHRFWLLPLEYHCMEDLVRDDDFTKAKRVAILCTDNAQHFPPTAIDDDGKLNLSFINHSMYMPNELSTMVGRTVVRKCCDRNEVFSITEYDELCMDNQGLATQFFDDLQSTANKEIFFRIGFPNNCAYKQQTTEFRLVSGSLQVRMDAESDWNEQLISTDDYCLEDFVTSTHSVGLPETINLASFCANQITPVEEFHIPTNYVNQTEFEDEINEKIKIPKCCLPGYVMEGENCQPLTRRDPESTVMNALNQHLRGFYNISGIFISNASLPCGFSKAYPLLPINDIAAKLKFHLQEERNLSLSMHIYKKNDWDFELQLHNFCLDISLFRNLGDVSSFPQVFFCDTPSHVSGHYPVLLSISSAALLATFIIYFFVPASGSAKLVTSFGGGKNARGRRIPSMAMMLTGRILLCHVLTLAVTYISLAVGQHEYFSTANTPCRVLGYIIYGASIASFSWLTVYCFDYCRIFSGSFKVSNELLFIPYSAFGWGLPIIAVTAAAIAQFQSTELGIPSTSNPNMGLMRCWFSGGKSAMIFFYIPVSVLILINIMFFLTLLLNPNLMNCWKKKKQISVRANRNAPKVSKEQQDLRMAIKLFFITGVPWVFEIAAWLPIFLEEKPFLGKNYIYFFEISNLLNSLRGVIIFIIFIVLQRDVRRYMMKQIFNMRDTVKNSGTQRASNDHQSQSQSFSTSTHRPTTSNTQLSSSSSRGAMSENKQTTNKPDIESDEISHL